MATLVATRCIVRGVQFLFVLFSAGALALEPSSLSLDGAVLVARTAQGETRLTGIRPITSHCGKSLAGEWLAQVERQVLLGEDGHIFTLDTSEPIIPRLLELGVAELVGNDHHLDWQLAQTRARADHVGVWQSCAAGLQMSQDLFTLVGAETGVSPTILAAIALKESARNKKPWPWTLNVHGKGYFYNTRQETYEALQRFQHAGFTSIDVGPMQVNIKFNGRYFASTWDATDPKTNIQVAAEILKKNYNSTGSVESAIAHYHSKTPHLSEKYLKGVIAHWRSLQGRGKHPSS
jgi:hypothetical protein